MKRPLTHLEKVNVIKFCLKNASKLEAAIMCFQQPTPEPSTVLDTGTLYPRGPGQEGRDEVAKLI